MKKWILCILLTLILTFSALPLRTDAADTESAPVGAAITVNVQVNADSGTVTASWSAYPNAHSYALYFLNYSARYDDYMQVYVPVKIDASEPRSYTFGYNYTLAYGSGGTDYRIRVYAMDQYGDKITDSVGTSAVFSTGIPLLSGTTRMDFHENGFAIWRSVKNAAGYNVALYTERGNPVDSKAVTENHCDFSSKMEKDYRYYYTVQASNPLGMYRYSDAVKSSIVTCNGMPTVVTGLTWNGNILSWNAYPEATRYSLILYRKLPSETAYHSVGNTFFATGLSYDFTTLFKEYGSGSYQVRITARISEPISSPAMSPEKSVDAGWTLNGTVTSYLSDSDSVVVYLTKSGGLFPSIFTASGNSADYLFKNVSTGEYTLTVMKKNHATREETITVSGNMTYDIALNPIGDVNGNGRVQSNDAMLAYKHAQGKAADQLTGYAAVCADANGNGKVQSNDAMQIYKQAQGQHVLW